MANFRVTSASVSTAKTFGAASPGAAEASTEVTASLIRGDFGVLDDCRQGKTAAGQFRWHHLVAGVHVDAALGVDVPEGEKSAEIPHVPLIVRMLDVPVVIPGQVLATRTV